MNFTRGPWRTSGHDPFIYGEGGKVAYVTERFMNREERLANAALISAAPEMYSALLECEALVYEYPVVRQMVRNVLKKAKGQT